jgi:adenomatosis polyposis coli protein
LNLIIFVIDYAASTSNTSNSQDTAQIKCNLQLLKENPIDMMRAGAPLLPPYLPVRDEMNKFIVEDSPCNFSLMSGLSAISIDSSPKVIHQQGMNKCVNQ